MAEKLAENAILSGQIKINGTKYDLIFNKYSNNYDVYLNKVIFASYNTRSVNQCKKWLKEYLNN